MRLVDAIRDLLAATNDKAYRSPEDQAAVTEAHAALAEWDALLAEQRRGRTVESVVVEWSVRP
jgi:hypothetical protein